MKDPRTISILDYTYTLPDGRIARYPLPERDASKLLVYREGRIGEDRYSGIASHLPAASLLIFNNSKVVQARLAFRKPTGGIIEVFCLEPDPRYGNLHTAMEQCGKVYWHCLIGGASKWKAGQVLEMPFRHDGEEGQLRSRYARTLQEMEDRLAALQEDDERLLREGEQTVAEIEAALKALG